MATAYVLGTFDDPLEALHDFEGHAILVLLTGAEQDPDTILDRDTECGINDEVPIFFPPPITAKAWLEAEATALLHVHCANPLDCPELDRIPIRSHGCNPPPNCIAEPDALVAATANPTCAEPTFFPPSSPTTRLLRNLNFGYATASAVAYDMSFENTTSLVNYVEFPFWNRQVWRADPVQTTYEYGVDFQGTVRVWESGTVQFIGEGRFIQTNLPGSDTSLSELSYFLWFTGSPGSVETVFTVPSVALGETPPWHAVNWSGRPGVGEAVELQYGASPSSIGDGISVWNYPNGLFVPPEIYGGLPPTTNGITAAEMVRDGNDIDVDWAFTPEPFTTQHWGFSWELDSSDFSSDNFTNHFNLSTLGGSQSGSFTRTIPDSSIVGLRFQIARATINRTTNQFDVGPFFRTAYSTPTIQQGIDPIP